MFHTKRETFPNVFIPFFGIEQMLTLISEKRRGRLVMALKLNIFFEDFFSRLQSESISRFINESLK